MTQVIHKYPIPLATVSRIDLPIDAFILTVQVQGNGPVMWAQVNPANELRPRTVYVIGTGHTVRDEHADYVGTVQIDGFVWHIYITPEY